MNTRQAQSILKVGSGASEEDVKRSFRKLAFSMHPDLNPSPDAAQEFRKLNEAYVFLRNVAGNSSSRKTSAGQTCEAHQKTDFKSRTDRKTASDGAKAYQKQQSKPHAETRKNTTSNAQQSRYFFQKEEDVLKDILNDPFARQVFEDIYSQISKDKPFQKAAAPVKDRKLNLSWGEKTASVDVSSGLKDGIKSWMKGQMDDEQTVYFPAATLIPGRNIRITIQQGIRKKVKTLEITLPRDFVIGRAIRLKGQGRHLGPFKGDLYLRIMAK
ncbi:DnaJ domain-containing protein [Maridesulfovibrio hydrothermalis]|uniref:Heat shock protein DnaJ domain protein n=1 Tax=Maridesulfovibrio hydrothermalis AM13 = DSM 14728 TaxID=1121451 RepID=L0RDU1_9BACT|nr:DnaJ domain-containing protein [Maridesulfovibrio hydrothermalis]CCO24904.1 Heat shock protein DnaJ domain protein [Maridesulfovibrio hydrothermalis AM13 = DSM 14728]